MDSLLSSREKTENAVPNRIPWDDYFMGIAREVSLRGTCGRKQVGAVLVRDRTILSTGYNGSPRGQPHCVEEGVGCEMDNGHCVRTVHAEANAIAQAARNGVSSVGSTLYTTASPCYLCAKLIVNAGVVRVVYDREYRPDERCERLFESVGVECERMKPPV